MARYEATSVEFGEKLKEQRLQERDKIAKQQEKFAKKIATADFLVKGFNEVLDSRAKAFNTSLADERTYLKTQQANATNFLNAHKKNVLDNNISVREYLDALNAENFQTLAENYTPGVIQQVERDGKIVEQPVYDIDKTTFRNLKNFTIGKGDKAVTFNSYEDFLDSEVERYNRVLTHAKGVPSDAKDIDAYLQQYADQQMPTSIFSFVTQGARRFLKGETGESLRDKIARSTEENLRNPLFSSYTKFASEMEAYNERFPNKMEGMINNFVNNIEKDAAGNIIDKRVRKIISDTELTFQLGSVVSVDPATNRKITTKTALPVQAIKYADGSTSNVAGKALTISTGEDLLVVFNSQVQNTLNTSLTNVGQRAWQDYVAANTKEVNSNVFKAFSDFIKTDVGKTFIAPDLDPAKLVETFANSIGKDIIDFSVVPPREEFDTDEEYQMAMQEYKDENARLYSELFKVFANGLEQAGLSVTGVLGKPGLGGD